MNKKTKQKVISTSLIILRILAGVGFITIAGLIPSMGHILKAFGVGRKKMMRREYAVRQHIQSLMRRGLIREVEKDYEKNFQITDKGKKFLLRFELKSLSRKNPLKWDGKYRVVIFDIKENSRHLRDELRLNLINIGFICLQNSVWIYPFPCEDAINLLKKNLGLKNEIIYMRVDSIEGNKKLRRLFKLTKQ